MSGAEGPRYRASSGGKVELEPSGRIVRTSEHRFQMEVMVGSEQHLRRMLRKKAKESNRDLDELVAAAMKVAMSTAKQIDGICPDPVHVE